jgi:Fic family protein
MIATDFTPGMAGELSQIPDGIAFIPSLLPPTIKESRALPRAVGEARGALGEFAGEVRLVDNRDRITHPLAMREAALSNKIEGTNTAVAGVLLQGAGRVPEDPVQRSNQTEVLNYFRTLKVGVDGMRRGWPLGSPLVSSLHEELIARRETEGCTPGSFQKTQAYIGRRRESLAAALREARYVPPRPSRSHRSWRT